ncbi:hypothetical protein BH23PLA1_BH23PLA1_13550 [soil metagenome]
MRYWSLLFALAAVFSVGAFLYAPFDSDWWLPGYEATNTESVAELRRIEAEHRLTARRLDAIRSTMGGEQAPAVSPVEELDEIRSRLESDQRVLAGLAEDNVIPAHTRPAAEAAAEAAEALAEALEDLARGQQGEATSALIRAEGAVVELREILSGAFAVLGSSTSGAGREVDHLFVLILIITGVVFIGTMVVLVLASWKFVARPDRKADYYHGSQRLEVIWTIIPAAILVFIALYQMGTWADIKFRSNQPKVRPLAEVTARQFQWVIRYPGPDGRLNTADDLFTANDLHFVKGTPTVIYLKSEDVLHSFFLPQLRIKQDAVPGLTIPVWFDADKAGRYELLCAELCGWGHYKMRANVTVHETQSEFEEWMENALREQNLDQLATAADTADGTIVE